MVDVKEESIIDAELLKIFIIVGVVIAAILIIVAIILLIQHGKRKSAKQKLDELN